MKKSPTRSQTLGTGSNLLWVLASFETPDQMSINLHIIHSLNPGIVEYHLAYFCHSSYTFLVILVRRICLIIKALVPWSQRFFLKNEKKRASKPQSSEEREKQGFSLSPPLSTAHSFFRKEKFQEKTSGTRVRPQVLTWFNHSRLSRDLKINSVIMTVISK